MKNQEDKLNKLFDNYVNSDTSLEFSEYVTRESLNDPDFFRWLFDDPDISDFGENLSEERKYAFSCFIGSLSWLTYDIHFDDENNSNNKGFNDSFQECKEYIEMENGTNNSYFPDYKGGTVSIYCNELDRLVYETEIE